MLQWDRRLAALVAVVSAIAAVAGWGGFWLHIGW
jgi:hypothetical protein